MVNEEPKATTNSQHRQIAIERLVATEIRLTPTEEHTNTSDAIKLPLEHIPELGVAFSSLPEAFRTVTTTVKTPSLLQPTDKFGNPLDPSILQNFKDNSGLMGSYRDSANSFAQARFHIASGETTSTVQVPYDPTMLFMAAALTQINQKLDSIQKTLDDMFDYMRQRDKANMRGNLKTLADILNGYGLNYGNTTYMTNAHMKVLDIKQASAQDIELYSNQIRATLTKNSIELRTSVGKRLDKVLDLLKDCQLATYIHAFSLFLEPMLAENFESAKLADTVAKIESDSIAYRKLYTQCYDKLEASVTGTIDTALLRGLSSAGVKLGHAIATTPVGDNTLIDEALEGAGEGIRKYNDCQAKKLIEKLHQAKTPDVSPFKQSVREINALYNQPAQIAVDSENIYILPTESEGNKH